MKVNQACRLLVLEDNAGLPQQVRDGLRPAAHQFAVEVAASEGAAWGMLARARDEDQPFAFLVLSTEKVARAETLHQFIEGNPETDLIVCGDASVIPAADWMSKPGSRGRLIFLPESHAGGTLLALAEFAAEKREAAGHTDAELDQTKMRLAALQEQYRLLFDNSPIPIYTYDQTSLAFLAVNEAAVKLYGYGRDEFLKMTLADLAQPQDLPAFREKLSTLSGHAGNAGVWRHRIRSGSSIEVELTSHALSIGARQAWLSVVLDVTERSKLEAQFRQAQKMESVGQLASGIAHDFNNLLTVISGHAGMLMAGPPLDGKAGDSLREISEATKRASDLTRQLMTFSRKQELHLQVADLNEVVNNVGKMLRRILGEDVSLNLDFAPGLPSIKADLGMVEQVLMNLAVNSRDAMPKGGKLVISTSVITIDDAEARLNPEASPGQFVCLSFSDTGSGIKPEDLNRIFEPFFTTKEKGRGTGLGLATVYGIVKQHQGWIHVNSQLNRGTTFQVHLPAWHEKSAPTSLPTGEQRVIGGTETILLVEDEEPLLRLMHHILESFGYKVLDSGTGKEALTVWEQHKKRIDLLLSDLVLPDGMEGPELAKILKAEKPGLKIVFTSGYNAERADLSACPGAAFIQKPFHVRKLAEIVFDTLREH